MANDSDGKLRALALIIKFGHDLYQCKDLKSAASAAVNNSHGLLGFRSSALFCVSDHKKCSILGQFGLAEVNEYSSVAVQQVKLVAGTKFEDSGICVIRNEMLPEELAKNNTVYLLCKLLPPASMDQNHFYIWLLEYEKEIPDSAAATAQLMGKSISEALSLIGQTGVGNRRKSPKILKKTIKFALILLLITAAMFFPVRESSTAEFMLTAPEITAAYACLDGTVSQCLKQDGAFVRKGEVIIRFDTSELKYRLANAQSELKEAEAEYELALQNAFTDESKLGKVKLLRARCEVLQVSVDEAKWYLKNAEVRAGADGILVLMDKRAELVTGKAVKNGEKLFEIFGGDGMIAEIMVNERDSSILQEKFDTTLFLHTAPEKGITGEVLSASQYPVLNKQNQYSYPIRMKLHTDAEKDLRYGMRGVAKLSGKDVPLGYYLFKSLILYFRNW